MWQIQAMPRLEHMVDTLALNQCAGKNRTELPRALPRLEAFYIYPTRQVK